MDGADERPFGFYFLHDAQQELPKPARLLDPAEDRLDDLLPESIAALLPEHLHEEIIADYNDMIYGATREEIEARKPYAPDNAAPA